LLDVSLVALPFIVFGAMLLWRIRREQALERWAIDTAARCYNCGEPLPLDIPAGFDGCFTCGACGHAWKQSTKQESNSLIWSMEL
jgi:hypothetical protein